MSEGKDRIETISQWTRATAEFSTSSTIQEKDGVKFGILKYGPQFQGRSMILDAFREGRSRIPTPPFRVEYILLNPFSVFEDAVGIERSSARHTGLTIADGCAGKWMDYSYTVAETTGSKTARLSCQSSEGMVERLKIELNEPEDLVLNYADMIMAGVLDYICFAKEIPLSIHHIEVYESKTSDLIRLYVVLPYLQKAQIDAQLLNGVGSVPEPLVPLLRLFREAVNSINPFYRLLCLFRVGEGLEKIRRQNNQRIKNLESPRKRPRPRIPENEFTTKYFKKWIGKSMHDYLNHVEHNFRNYIAHLNIDESLNLTPDPGWTKHAFDTDTINGMLISIIRQLIYDEWTFMKENRIESVPATSEKSDQ